MPSLASTSTQFLFFIGDSFALSKLRQVCTRAPIHTTLRFLRHDCHDKRVPLSLASLGFRNELEAAVDEKSIEKQNDAAKVLKIREKVSRSIRMEKAGTKGALDIEGAPFAAKSFSDLSLPPWLLERLEKEGFRFPTDVQSTAVPVIRNNHDVVIQSYTGSGKTLAYLLPILSELVSPKKNDGNKQEIKAVVVAPSRELGMQICREVEKLLGPEDKRLVQQLVGGANRSRQEEALKKNKPIIVVGTPGRIAEISTAGKLHTHNCLYLVLDEVDELLSFNFHEAMHRILEHVGRRPGATTRDTDSPDRRIIMVSATVPFSVIRAATSWGKDPFLVQAKTVSPLKDFRPSVSVNVTGTAPAPPESTLPPGLKHYYSVSRIQHKVDTLRRCIHALDAKSVIVFMNHSKQLKDTVYKLGARGITSVELHGDLNKLARSTTLKRFKNGEVRVLVTNELSARGLDVSECDLVVNLDLPTDSTHYAHRAGRTGRLGRKGVVVTVCEDGEVFVVKKLQKQLGISIEGCEFTDGKLVVDKSESGGS